MTTESDWTALLKAIITETAVIIRTEKGDFLKMLSWVVLVSCEVN